MVDWHRERYTCTKRCRAWMADFNSGPDPCQYIPLLSISLNHKARQRLIDDSTPPGNQWHRSNNFNLHDRMSTLSACYSYHYCPDIPHGLPRGCCLSKVHGTIYKAPTRDQSRLAVHRVRRLPTASKASPAIPWVVAVPSTQLDRHRVPTPPIFKVYKCS